MPMRCLEAHGGQHLLPCAAGAGCMVRALLRSALGRLRACAPFGPRVGGSVGGLEMGRRTTTSPPSISFSM